MRKLAVSLALACAVLTSACVTDTGGGGVNVTAPLASTKFDENAAITADRAFDVALDVVNLCIDLKVRIPGQPEDMQPFIPGTNAAKQLASTIRTVDSALNRAATISAAANGDVTAYKQALSEAQDGINLLKTILQTRK